MTAITHHYRPRGAAKAILEDRSPEILLSGPAGTGKSRAALEKLHLMALKYPGMRGLIVRKTLASLGSTALVTWREHVIPEALNGGIVKFYGGSPQESPQYKYRNGSVIVVGGMDRATRIMSSEYDVSYVQEAIELTTDDWEAISTRLRNGRVPYQQLMADTNPAEPTHWLKARCDIGTTRMLESRHEDNPLLFDGDGNLTERGRDYIARLDRLTGVRYYRLRKGLWVAAEGVVYEGWDPAVHLIDWFRPPDSWTRWWSVDFGFTNPFCCGMYAEDPDGRLYLYREIYHTKKTVDQHAIDIMAQVSEPDPNWRPRAGVRHPANEGRIWTEPKPRAIICDHDAEGREVLSREVGIGTIPAKKAKVEGIQFVQQRMRIAGDGRPRIYLMRDTRVERDEDLADAKKPTCTVEEIPSYVWDQSPGKAPKETPVDQDNHGMDQMRYLVAEREIGAPRIRGLG